MIELGKIAYIEPDAISLLAVVDSERMLESVELIKAKKTRQAQKGEAVIGLFSLVHDSPIFEGFHFRPNRSYF